MEDNQEHSRAQSANSPNTYPTRVQPAEPTWNLPDEAIKLFGTKWRWLPKTEEWAFYNYDLKKWHCLSRKFTLTPITKGPPPSGFTHTFYFPSAGKRPTVDSKSEEVDRPMKKRRAVEGPRPPQSPCSGDHSPVANTLPDTEQARSPAVTEPFSAALQPSPLPQTLDLIMDRAQACVELAKAPATWKLPLTAESTGESSGVSGSGHPPADKIANLEESVAKQAEIITKQAEIINKLKTIFKVP